MPTLREWQRKVEADYFRSNYAKPEFASWHEIPASSLANLFPDLRFFTTSWSERPIPGKERAAAFAWGLGVTLICTADGKLVRSVGHHGNYEEFGEFLAVEKIAIHSAGDAKRVWDAYCDLHQKHWKDQTAIKVSDTVWHLGKTTVSGAHYYYEVKLDSAQTVVSAKLHADDPNRPSSK
jgi:hypothetical protein